MSEITLLLKMKNLNDGIQVARLPFWQTRHYHTSFSIMY